MFPSNNASDNSIVLCIWAIPDSTLAPASNIIFFSSLHEMCSFVFQCEILFHWWARPVLMWKHEVIVPAWRMFTFSHLTDAKLRRIGATTPWLNFRLYAELTTTILEYRITLVRNSIPSFLERNSQPNWRCFLPVLILRIYYKRLRKYLDWKNTPSWEGVSVVCPLHQGPQ